MDDLRHEFGRFQRTIEKVGEMASEGMRVVQEFNTARSQSQYPTAVGRRIESQPEDESRCARGAGRGEG